MHKNICYGCLEEKKNEEFKCKNCGYVNGKNLIANHIVPGTLIESRYLIGRSIGVGGFGITYIAIDTKIKTKVAIKEFFIKIFCTRSSEGVIYVENTKKKRIYKKYKEKFLTEAKILAKYNLIEGIVSISNCFEENNSAYIVMEYLKGNTLEYSLKKNTYKTFKECISSLLPIINSLKVIHENGFIHRDISADNIFITSDSRVKLLDFGSTRKNNIDTDKHLSVLIKKSYAPIEQYRKYDKQGPYTDIYSLGATIYYMLEGKLLEDASSRIRIKDDCIKTMKKQLNKSEKRILRKMIELNSKDRYQNIDELLMDIVNKNNKIRNISKKSKKKIFYFLSLVSTIILLLIYIFDKNPDYIGLNYFEESSKIPNNITVDYEYNDEVKKNNIIKQNINRKFIARWEEQVIVVSKGSSEVVKFDDINLENAIKTNINKKKIKLGDLEDLVELDLSNKNIKSLKGLEKCKNLRTLNLYRNNIKDITSITSLYKLENLVLSNNSISNISDLIKLKNLIYINLNNNKLTDEEIYDMKLKMNIID